MIGIRKRDALEHMSNEMFYGSPRPPQTVETCMKRHPICVTPDVDAFALGSLLVSHGYRHLPVVDTSNQLLRIVKHGKYCDGKRNLGLNHPLPSSKNSRRYPKRCEQNHHIAQSAMQARPNNLCQSLGMVGVERRVPEFPQSIQQNSPNNQRPFRKTPGRFTHVLICRTAHICSGKRRALQKSSCPHTCSGLRQLTDQSECFRA